MPVPFLPFVPHPHTQAVSDIVFPLWPITVGVVVSLICTVIIYRQMVKDETGFDGTAMDRVMTFVLSWLVGILCGLLWPLLPVGIVFYWLLNRKNQED